MNMESFTCYLKTHVKYIKDLLTTGDSFELWINNLNIFHYRMYEYGEFHECLINHDVNCKGSCQLYGSKDKKYKPMECDCKKKKTNSYYDVYNDDYY